MTAMQVSSHDMAFGDKMHAQKCGLFVTLAESRVSGLL